MPLGAMRVAEGIAGKNREGKTIKGNELRWNETQRHSGAAVHTGVVSSLAFNERRASFHRMPEQRSDQRAH